MQTIKPNGLRDIAQAIAEKIRPVLTADNDWELRLNGSSTVWLEDIHGSGYVAWAEDNNGFTRMVLPELRQIVSGADRLPDEDELRAFITACVDLIGSDR